MTMWQNRGCSGCGNPETVKNNIAGEMCVLILGAAQELSY